MAVKAQDKNEVKVKKEENVALAVTQSGGSVFWCCGKAGHIKAFCTAKPIRGKAVEQANVTLVAIRLDSDDKYLMQVLDSDSKY